MGFERFSASKRKWWMLTSAGVATAALYLFGGGVAQTAEEKSSTTPKVPAVQAAGLARFALETAPADQEQLRGKFHEEQIALLEKLNRADQVHLVRLPEIVVPERWDLDELDYSPLPSVWQDVANSAKTIVLSQPFQVFGAYEKGKLVRWGPVSSGRKTKPTPPGLFYLNWKSKGRKSTVDGGWFLRWYFNFINERGISFHEFDLPGRPESHGCVRLLSRDAEWIFHWGEQWKLDAQGWKVDKQGTPVLILGKCEYDKPASWLSTAYLAADRPVRLDGGAVPEELLTKLRQSLIPVPASPAVEDGLAGPSSGSGPSAGETSVSGPKSAARPGEQ